jgi:hypothetical protein
MPHIMVLLTKSWIKIAVCTASLTYQCNEV